MFHRIFLSRKGLLPTIFLLTSLLGLTFYTWRRLPEVVPLGEGLVYLVKPTQNVNLSLPGSLANFETGAILFAKVLSSSFGTNFEYYYSVSLVFLLGISLIFFFMVYALTGEKLLSFLSALMFSVMYMGSWAMYAQAVYSLFLERVVNMVFILPSFLFLHLYLKHSKYKYYLISISLYFVGVGFSHWFVLFTAPFLLYPIFWRIFKNENKKLRTGVLIGLSYLFLSAFFVGIQQITQGGLGPKMWTFTEFLVYPEIYLWPEKIIRQLTIWTSYPLLLKGINLSPPSYRMVPMLYLIDIPGVIDLVPYIVVSYVVAFLVIYFKLKEQRHLLFTVTLGTLAIFYLNAYFGQYDILNSAGANRYLYLPTVLLVIFWSLFLWAVFIKRGALGKTIAILIVGIYYLVNSWIISESFKWVISWDKPTKIVYDYVDTLKPRLKEGMTIVLPYPQTHGYEAQFFNDHLGTTGATFITDYIPEWEQLASDSKYSIRLIYVEDCDCVVEE